MKKGFLFLMVVINCLCINAFAADFIACQGTYALCTTALCKPIPGKTDAVSCKCIVKTGYSAGTKACQPIQQTGKNKLIYSRYYPIKSYVSCANNRPWAWCLDSPCLIDKKHPSKAACMCSIVKEQGKYVIVTNRNTSSTCTTGLYSSATVDQVNQITEFLKTQTELQPFPIKVYNEQ